MMRAVFTVAVIFLLNTATCGKLQDSNIATLEYYGPPGPPGPPSSLIRSARELPGLSGSAASPPASVASSPESAPSPPGSAANPPGSAASPSANAVNPPTSAAGPPRNAPCAPGSAPSPPASAPSPPSGAPRPPGSAPGSPACKYGDVLYRNTATPTIREKCICVNHPLMPVGPTLLCEPEGCADATIFGMLHPPGAKQNGCECIPGMNPKIPDRAMLYHWGKCGVNDAAQSIVVA